MYPILFVSLGFFISELFVGLGWDTGIRHDNLGLLINGVFLPPIIYGSALSFGTTEFKKDVLASIIFTLPVFLLTLAITSVFIYFAINHPTGFPWLAALIVASLLTPVTTHPISHLLKTRYFTRCCTTLLKGESLLSGMLSVACFYSFLSLAVQDKIVFTFLYSVARFFYLWWVGIGLGGVIGGMYYLMLYYTQKYLKNNNFLWTLRVGVSVVVVYGTYFLVEYVFSGAGAIGVFSAGIVSRMYFLYDKNNRIVQLWSVVSDYASYFIFALLGVTVTVSMFGARWLAMIIGIIGLVIARMGGVLVMMPIISLIGFLPKISIREQLLLSNAGIRGEISIILAFAVPEMLHYWWTIQSIAFGVVLFTLAVQAPLMVIFSIE